VKPEIFAKQDGQPNILVPETPDKAIRLPKPLFGAVEETPEMTSLFASPDSASYASRPMDPGDTSLKTPGISEYRKPRMDFSIEKKEHQGIPTSGSSPRATLPVLVTRHHYQRKNPLINLNRPICATNATERQTKCYGFSKCRSFASNSWKHRAHTDPQRVAVPLGTPGTRHARTMLII